MKYILHIGRSKTGTSSLQRFLHTNRDVLARCGVYYPKSGLRNIAHHEIARYFVSKIRSVCSQNELSQMQKTLRELSEEILNKDRTILLSSEAFQNCEPELLLEVFEPENTKIIVYLREQVDYFISSYQQRVHARNEYVSLKEGVRRYIVDYESFLKKWEKVFGRKNIEVRVYDRCRLFRGDIIHDFMNYLGIEITDDFIISPLDQNPSIGGALLEFKRVLNAFEIDQTLNRELYGILSSLAADERSYRLKPILDEKLVASMREKTRRSNQKVFKRYFNGENVFATASDKEGRKGEKSISLVDLWPVLGGIKKRNERIFRSVVRALLLPSQAQIFNSQLEEYPASGEEEALPNALIALLRKSVEARLEGLGNFAWNVFPTD